MKQKAHASHALAYARMKRERPTSWRETHGLSAEERVLTPLEPGNRSGVGQYAIDRSGGGVREEYARTSSRFRFPVPRDRRRP